MSDKGGEDVERPTRESIADAYYPKLAALTDSLFERADKASDADLPELARAAAEMVTELQKRAGKT